MWRFNNWFVQKLSGLKIGELFISIVFHMTKVADQIYCQEPVAPDLRTGLAGHGGLGESFFSFFNVLLVLVHLVVLVLLVVFLIFFSLFLQLVLLQRIVDIYVGALRKKFFVPSDGGATTWRFGLSEAHIGRFEAHHIRNKSSKV
jgi:hypothetical protein